MGDKCYVAKSHFTDDQLGVVTRRQILEGLSDSKKAELLAAKRIAPLLIGPVDEVNPGELLSAGPVDSEDVGVLETLKKSNSKSVKNP